MFPKFDGNSTSHATNEETKMGKPESQVWSVCTCSRVSHGTLFREVTSCNTCHKDDTVFMICSHGFGPCTPANRLICMQEPPFDLGHVYRISQWISDVLRWPRASITLSLTKSGISSDVNSMQCIRKLTICCAFTPSIVSKLGEIYDSSECIHQSVDCCILTGVVGLTWTEWTCAVDGHAD